jgi:glycosyltransferase involved in cell wall biosynthesis
MRVAHVITRLSVGGAQENTIETVLGVARAGGFQSWLISGPTRGAEGSLTARIPPDLLTVVPSLVRQVNPWFDFRAMVALAGHFRRRRPHIVHTHSGKAGVLGRIGARLARVPIIVHSIHGPSFGPFQGAVANLVFSTAERAAARCTDHFIVVADAMSRQYLAAGIGRPEQYTRVFSGFALEPFLDAVPNPALAARLGIQPGDFVVGTVARLFELKGHDDLLAAAPALAATTPRVRFLWVGDGSHRARLETEVARRGLSGRVIFTGLVAPEQVPDYIALMDCLAHLSRREGLPRALPQAMAAGKPVVAYDVDGAPEVCLEGETGFLAPVGDIVKVAHALGNLAASSELRRRLGSKGREFVAPRFGLQALVDGQIAVYRSLAATRGITFPAAQIP